MSQKLPLREVQRQLQRIEDEQKDLEKFTENYKKKLSEEIRQFDPKQIKNTPLREEKISLWIRFLRTLGIN
jgi:hypothetical protein